MAGEWKGEPIPKDGVFGSDVVSGEGVNLTGDRRNGLDAGCLGATGLGFLTGETLLSRLTAGETDFLSLLEKKNNKRSRNFHF